MAESIGMRPGDELVGKVAIVTGAARNIGRAIALSLAAGGATVVVSANTSASGARETVDLIEQAGGRAAVELADVTDSGAVERLVAAAVDRFGRLDILVNNAGTRAETPFENMAYEEWRRVLGVILDGAFLCSRAATPRLIDAGGGTIVNLGGQTGHTGAAHRAHVVTGKAGIAAFTKALALDLAPHGITVNCVAPFLIDTVRGLPGAPERPPERRIVPPVGRMGQSGDIAAMVRYLCGPDGRYITGQTIHVNGGGFMP